MFSGSYVYLKPKYIPVHSAKLAWACGIFWVPELTMRIQGSSELAKKNKQVESITYRIYGFAEGLNMPIWGWRRRKHVLASANATAEGESIWICRIFQSKRNLLKDFEREVRFLPLRNKTDFSPSSPGQHIAGEELEIRTWPVVAVVWSPAPVGSTNERQDFHSRAGLELGVKRATHIAEAMCFPRSHHS